MCFVVTCWERADLLGQVWYLIVSIPDFAPLLTFNMRANVLLNLLNDFWKSNIYLCFATSVIHQ